MDRDRPILTPTDYRPPKRYRWFHLDRRNTKFWFPLPQPSNIQAGALLLICKIKNHTMLSNYSCYTLKRQLIRSNRNTDESSIMQDEEANDNDVSESTIITIDSFSYNNDTSLPIKPRWMARWERPQGAKWSEEIGTKTTSSPLVSKFRQPRNLSWGRKFAAYWSCTKSIPNGASWFFSKTQNRLKSPELC